MIIVVSRMVKAVLHNINGRVGQVFTLCLMLLFAILCGTTEISAQNLKRGDKQIVSGGLLQQRDTVGVQRDTVVMSRADSLNRLKNLAKQARRHADSLARYERLRQRAIEQDRLDANGNILPPEPWFGDSVSLSRVCMVSAVLPGYGQIYNKQYWKLPILYGTMGTAIGLAIHQNSIYKPLKKEYDALILKNGLSRTEELNLVQRKMIRSNTTRQLL